MKLIHIKTGFIVLEFQKGKTLIYDRVLDKQMRTQGILIPASIRKLYDGKKAIRLSDDTFQTAFKDLFFHQIFDSKQYAWV